jgi:hypothetical protein
MSLSGPERALVWILRINGVITCLALPFVFMPVDWMDTTHRYFGMGPLLRTPVVEYLARTVSYLYFAHGALCLLLSTDVRRFGPVITCVASLSLAFAFLVFWIDQKSGMPRRWTYIEFAAVTFFSGSTLLLRIKSNRPAR